MSRRPWPWPLLVGEGLRTALTGRWTSLLVVTVVAWTCAVIGGADALAVSRTPRAEQEWVDAGAYVLRVTGAPSEGRLRPVPAPACERLADVSGVSDTFWAQRRGDPESFAHVPGGRFSVVDVSPGAFGFLAAEVPATASVLVSSGLAERVGLVDGAPVVVGTSGVLRARTSDVAVLGDDFDGVLLAPAGPRSRAETCFVRTDATHVAGVTQLAASVLGWDGTDAVVTPRLHSGQFTVDFSRAHEDRELRRGWAAGAGVLAMLWAVVQWFRRGHTAVYATFGVTAARRVVMQTAEWLALALAGLAWGWSLGVVGAVALGADVRSALVQVSVQSAATVLVASALVVLVALRPTGTLLDQLKDR